MNIGKRLNVDFLMFRMRSVIIGLIVGVFWAVFIPTPDSAFSAQDNAKPIPVTLQLRWFHQFQFAGYYAALEKGFYRRVGLDVTILERNLRSSPVDDVLSGIADFGVSNSEVLLHFMQGKPLVVLASVIQHSPLVLVSPAEKEIHNPHDLIGKKVLMSTQTLDVELPAMFREEGIPMKSIRIKDAFADRSDYFDPSLDALAAYSTNQPFYYEQEGIPYNVMHPSTYGIDFYGDTLFTTRRLVEDRPQEVKAFLDASLMGWKYAMEHTDELIDLILYKYKSKKSRKHLEFEAERIRELMMPELVEIGQMNAGRWQHIAKTFSEMGMGPIEYSLDGFMYEPDHPEQPLPLGLVLILSVLWVATVIGILVVVRCNRRLKKQVRERKELEQKLATRENYCRTVFENTGTATVIYDENGLILKCNTRFAEMVGRKVEDIENVKEWTEFLAPKDKGSMLDIHEKRDTPDDPHPKQYDYKLMDATGEIRHAHVQMDLIPGTTHRVASIVDITEQIKTEELLVHTEKMVSVGGLAAGMAHEINNPLAGILQGTQNLIRRLTPGLALNDTAARNMGVEFDVIKGYLEERHIYRVLDGIKESGERAAVVVRTLLSFISKGESDATGQNLNELLDTVVEMIAGDYDLAAKFDINQVEIVRNYSPDVENVICSRTEMEQVFLNMVRNAVYAVKGNPGTRPPRIELSTERDGQFAAVRIQDNGPGLSERARKQIFEPFSPVESSGTGSGFGLAVAYFIVTRNHGGSITVGSTPGIGTIFTIRLPMEGCPAEEIEVGPNAGA